jgi:hypothetical protein
MGFLGSPLTKGEGGLLGFFEDADIDAEVDSVGVGGLLEGRLAERLEGLLIGRYTFFFGGIIVKWPNWDPIPSIASLMLDEDWALGK